MHRVFLPGMYCMLLLLAPSCKSNKFALPTCVPMCVSLCQTLKLAPSLTLPHSTQLLTFPMYTAHCCIHTVTASSNKRQDCVTYQFMADAFSKTTNPVRLTFDHIDASNSYATGHLIGITDAINADLPLICHTGNCILTNSTYTATSGAIGTISDDYGIHPDSFIDGTIGIVAAVV